MMNTKELESLASALANAAVESENQGIEQSYNVTHTVISNLWACLPTEQFKALNELYEAKIAHVRK
ncbi:hypothetical protein [Vibrio gangliei]|uniref:hypothetical protein n=1 Tax=Vibrio gangliei TaxID=2077090 RepID=UPI001474FDEA|nr:hypothetical protein [Vibrio gangliei]